MHSVQTTTGATLQQRSISATLLSRPTVG